MMKKKEAGKSMKNGRVQQKREIIGQKGERH
jgi:hypothetical protein